MKNSRKGKNWIWYVLLVLFILVAAVILITVFTKDKVKGATPSADVSLEAAEAGNGYWISVKTEDIVTVCEASDDENADGDVWNIGQGDTVSIPFEISKAGKYALLLEYQTTGQTIVQSDISVSVDDRQVSNNINGVWCDESKDYILDRYENEVTPQQVKIDVYARDYVRDSATLNMDPVVYDLAQGSHELTVDCTDQGILLKKVMIVNPPVAEDYESYLQQNSGDSAAEPIIIEGESYLAKSDSYVRTKSDINASCAPYNAVHKLLNAVDYASWKTAGQRVVWNFTVPEDGWYHLAFHYTQSQKEGMDVYRDIEIDGEIPFAEMKEFAFAYTGSKYANAILKADGEEARIYLTKGEHTISLFTNAPSLAPVVEDINDMIEELSDIGLELQKVAGSKADKNRTWDIETYIPGVTDHLADLQERLEGSYQELQEISGSTAASCVNLKLAASIIEQVLKRPDKLPTYVEQISIGSGSATDLLAQLVNTLDEQGMSLDHIILYGENDKLASGNTGFLRTIGCGTKRFIYSLLHRDGSYGVTEDAKEDENAITVWVNRPISYVETLQLMADSRFTSETGIKVYFSIMPDEGKLLLANASDTCPDVALGVTSDRPYQLGARGAALDLTEFDDFADFAEGLFDGSDLEPYVYDGNIYGIPETKQFYVLMYRTDIMEKLDLTVPQTWDDVADMMWALRRSGMNFYLPLSSATGVKPLFTIAPFFLQNGAELYSEDGLSTELNSEKGIEAFTELTNLYTLHSMQNNMPSFYNNFRYGTTPIGVTDFGTYVQMLYAAPEIADKWAIAPAPGTVNEQGEICRQQVSADRGCMILGSTTKADKSWEFLKWWMSTETQVEFSNTLQTKYGMEYVWNSANADAFQQLSFPVADREVILEQWNNAENYRTMPATYMVERALSDAWYQIVEDHISPRVALNEAVFTMDQEMQIRMKQFGYIDDNGNVIREYDMRSAEQILKDLRGNSK